MSKLRGNLIGLCMAAASLGALAQNAEDHKAHHPAEEAAAAMTGSKPMAKSASPEAMAKMEQQMKSMQAMHDKMMAAKTPEERQALMAEGRKMMQDGMAMMQQMGGIKAGRCTGGSMAKCQKMLEKRMDMMEAMMQMMMDRMP